MNEQEVKTVKIICLSILIFMLGSVATCGTYHTNRDLVIARMVEAGATPQQASCAIFKSVNNCFVEGLTIVKDTK